MVSCYESVSSITTTLVIVCSTLITIIAVLTVNTAATFL